MCLPRAVLLASVMACSASGQTFTISTLAGSGPPKTPNNVAGTSASLNQPLSVAVDGKGNLFFTDLNTVFRFDTATGGLTIAAGNGMFGSGGGGGPATSAQLSMPSGIAVDSAGNLYISDSGHYRIRKVSNGVVTTVAGNGMPGFSGDNGAATSAELFDPSGVAVDSTGDLYIADTGNGRIRKVSNGVITTVAGNGNHGDLGDDGPATSAQLSVPQGVAVDSAGNLYIADGNNNRVRKVSNGVITTLTGGGRNPGDGPAASASLSNPRDVTVDSSGNLYIAEWGRSRIRKVSNGMITTVAGNGGSGFSGDSGPATTAQLSFPSGVAVDAAGNLYIADIYNRRIRKVSNGVITTVAGNGTEPWRFNGDNGPATSALLSGPGGVAVDAAGNVYFTDSFRVRKVSNGVITTVAGTGEEGGDNVPATSAELYGLRGIAVSSAGDLYIADGLSHLSAMEYSNVNNRIRKVSKAVITTVAGKADTGYSGDNGPANLAQLDSPVGVAVDSAGNLYIADSQNNRIRKVSNGVITTVAGNGESGFSGDGGPATRARLFKPTGVAVDPAGNLYIADTANSRVRKVSRGVITTVAGNGTIGFSGDGGPATSAQLIRPNGLAVDSAGKIYIVDEVHRIREISNGVITTVAGNGTPGFSGDNGPAATAQLYWPSGLAVDSAGKIYVAEIGNERIRLLTPASSSCSASVTPTTLSSRASGGNLIVSIKTTSASCAWAVQSLLSWITYSGNVVGTGSASVELLVAKNRGASRRATVSIAGIPVTITQ